MAEPTFNAASWLIRWCVTVIAVACIPVDARAAADPLLVRPGTSLSSVRERLAGDTGITEVVFEKGTYAGGLHLDGGKADPGRPLLIRAADGAKVTFDGSTRIEGFKPHESLPGIFWLPHGEGGGEPPKIWEPGTRTRYRLVADTHAVVRFPASYTIEGGRLLFHTRDGKAPREGALLASEHDCGIFVNRPDVTVRGIHFRNYLARDKWSTGVDLRVDRITVEDCTSTNCSHGFIITGNGNALRGCSAEDVGGGVYVGGRDATVERCRFFKRRDGFMVPMYAQDDTGIQFYVPAKGGLIRGNLCVGFGMGVFIKASAAPYRVEHNTLFGLGQGLGFGATNWHEGERFQYNIVADCDRQVEISGDAGSGGVNHNCYWSRDGKGLKAVGDKDIVADPRFARPEWDDFRLLPDSPCLKISDSFGPCGAFPAAGDAAQVAATPPREWHVAEDGVDGRKGTATEPVRTVQFAVDRARPGDTITVHPGLYPEPVRIRRGGTKDRPIVLRSAARWAAILDCNRSAPVMVDVENAPHVEVRDFEIRWYDQVAVRVIESPHVTVSGCRIWNAHWGGAWPTGTAARVERSPGFVGRENVVFRQEHGFWMYNSPGFTLTNNTCAANLYSAMAALYSCENSVCRNNSFAFQGNDVIVIEENLGQAEKLKSFDCDFNNYGTALRPQPAGTTFDSVTPREKDGHLAGGSKAIVNYTEYKGRMKRFVTMEEWRSFSGLDRHTIFADPLYRETAGRDFSLEPRSPNVRAGADGGTIGASTVPQAPSSAAPSAAAAFGAMEVPGLVWADAPSEDQGVSSKRLHDAVDELARRCGRVVPEWNLVVVRLGTDGNVPDEVWDGFFQNLSGALAGKASAP